MTKSTPLHLKMRKIVNKYDPIHLIAIGCSKDEYNGEVKRILNKWKNVSSVEELHDLIYGIFVKMFFKNIAGPKENYQKMSADLFKLKQN